MHDDLIVWQNIIAMTACAVLAATYLPLLLRGLKWGRRKFRAILTHEPVASLRMPEIVVLAVGLVLMALGTFSVRGYSLAMREFDLMFLRSSIVAPLAIGLQTAGAVIAALAFYLNPSNRALTISRTRGLWFGAIVLAILVSGKYLF